MNKPQPAFDRDYCYGKQGELLVCNLLDAVARGDGQVEMKRKRKIDLLCYIETSCDKGRKGLYKPSGISVTTAEFWVIIVHDTDCGFFFPTRILKEFLCHPSVRDAEETDGSCPTKGKLVNVAALLWELNRRKKESIKP
jgi:hypothetical protein